MCNLYSVTTHQAAIADLLCISTLNFCHERINSEGSVFTVSGLQER